MRVAKCNLCKTLYCNDIRIFQFKYAKIESKNGIVEWSGYIKGKDTIRPIFRDVPIFLVRDTEDFKTDGRIILCKFLVAEKIKLDAYYSINNEKNIHHHQQVYSINQL